ncbi:hypothetical protein C8Q78DRAFT_496935 [Trametes maxima]|nr:hypothetical protein C8Q78DRAFT_496935 [Trametes maxima]
MCSQWMCRLTDTSLYLCRAIILVLWRQHWARGMHWCGRALLKDPYLRVTARCLTPQTQASIRRGLTDVTGRLSAHRILHSAGRKPGYGEG